MSSVNVIGPLEHSLSSVTAHACLSEQGPDLEQKQSLPLLVTVAVVIWLAAPQRQLFIHDYAL
jgi:hypothetical protein